MKRILLIRTFSSKHLNETWITKNTNLMMLSFIHKDYVNMVGIDLEMDVIQGMTEGIIFHYD